MSALRNILLLAALLAAGVAGYFVGARSGQDAKEALAKLEAETRLGEAEQKKTTEALKAQVMSLTTNYEAEKAQINADYAARHGKLSALLASRDQAIADLKARSSSDRSEINQLRAHLNDPQTPQEKQAKLDRIAQLGDDARATKQDWRGDQCLKVPVPKDILATLREGKS